MVLASIAALVFATRATLRTNLCTTLGATTARPRRPTARLLGWSLTRSRFGSPTRASATGALRSTSIASSFTTFALGEFLSFVYFCIFYLLFTVLFSIIFSSHRFLFLFFLFFFSI